jgi:sarcosine oxidase, subunit beta
VAAGADVAVVGGGITGLSVALFLAELGCDVLVLEKSGIGAGASGIQPGGVRQQWSTRVNCLLAREALSFYRELDERLGVTVEATLDACGYLFLAQRAPALEALRENVRLQNECGVPSRIVDPKEVGELVPGLVTDSVIGGAWCAEDAYFDRPQTVVEAFAAAAQEQGARCRLSDVHAVEAGGDRWTLITGDGLVEADHVVVAAACDTVGLLEPLGVRLPIAAEARHLFLSEPHADRLLEPLVISGERHFAAKQLANGRVLASDLAAAGDPDSHREEWRRTVSDGIRELLPILSYVSFPILATGIYDLTPDHQPIVCAVPGAAGLWVAAGYSGHGFMLAPPISRRLAAAIAGSPIDSMLAEFDLDRFARSIHVETQVV